MYSVQNVTAVVWAFLGFCCTFFVAFFCVTAQLHITALSSLGLVAAISRSDRSYFSQFQNSSPYGRALLLALLH